MCTHRPCPASAEGSTHRGWRAHVGLALGKPVGITLSAWVAVRTGLAALPTTIDWRHIFGVARLGAIGFTMSLFIWELAFGMAPVADAVRIGVRCGSVIAGAVGFLVLGAVLPPHEGEGRA